MTVRMAALAATLAVAWAPAAPAQRPAGCAVLAADGIPADVARVVAETLRRPPAAIRPEARLAEDLQADDLAQVEIVMALERRFGIEIDDARAREARTVGALSDLTIATLRPGCRR